MLFRASPYILTFRCLCNNNFVRICCEYSFFLLVSDEYFYFEFRMCTFYGYFHCVAVFTAFTVNTLFPWISGTFVSAASFN